MATNYFTYKVPQDVAFDVLRLVIQNRVKYKIAGVKQKENIMLLEINISSSTHGVKVKDCIETILNDYKEYMQDIVPDALIIDEDDN